MLNANQQINQSEAHSSPSSNSAPISSPSTLISAFTASLGEEQAKPEKQAWSLINLMDQAHALLAPYLRSLYIRVLNRQFGEVDPLTSQERRIFDSYTPWQRAVITTGSPLGMPEHRPYLSTMPGPTPGGPPPQAAPAPGPPAGVALPVPAAAPMPGPSQAPDPMPGPSQAQHPRRNRSRKTTG